ncbi:hypothetical protein EYF80_035597 [Liparis tanakae]|uniref:Uncharacterized protein n=1 Tax=Liparis tanakae TaxID=230148 RepID=A0A4Z2GLE9_9TELE|nr:hypothetical protein EYF80_035597 [Liparis tanakae]
MSRPISMWPMQWFTPSSGFPHSWATSMSAGCSPASCSASFRTVRMTARWCLAVSLGRNPEGTTGRRGQEVRRSGGQEARRSGGQEVRRSGGQEASPCRRGRTLPGGRDVGAPRVGEHLPVSDDPDADLIGAAFEADHDGHGG